MTTTTTMITTMLTITTLIMTMTINHAIPQPSHGGTEAGDIETTPDIQIWIITQLGEIEAGLDIRLTGGTKGTLTMMTMITIMITTNHAPGTSPMSETGTTPLSDHGTGARMPTQPTLRNMP